MLHARTFPQDYLKDLVSELEDIYPKCFFTDPRHKTPLKKSIIDDLQSDGFHDKDDRVAAISYYTKDWNYEWCLQAGAKRVDLEGREVGTVTQQEEREARERVQSQQRKIREEREATTQQQAPVAVVTASITNKPSAR